MRLDIWSVLLNFFLASIRDQGTLQHTLTRIKIHSQNSDSHQTRTPRARVDAPECFSRFQTTETRNTLPRVYFFCPHYCERVCLFVLDVIDTKETNAFVSIGNPIRKKKKKNIKVKNARCRYWVNFGPLTKDSYFEPKLGFLRKKHIAVLYLVVSGCRDMMTTWEGPI